MQRRGRGSALPALPLRLLGLCGPALSLSIGRPFQRLRRPSHRPTEHLSASRQEPMPTDEQAAPECPFAPGRNRSSIAWFPEPAAAPATCNCCVSMYAAPQPAGLGPTYRRSVGVLWCGPASHTIVGSGNSISNAGRNCAEPDTDPDGRTRKSHLERENHPPPTYIGQTGSVASSWRSHRAPQTDGHASHGAIQRRGAELAISPRASKYPARSRSKSHGPND